MIVRARKELERSSLRGSGRGGSTRQLHHKCMIQTVKLTCSLCKANFTKKLAEVTHQNSKWVKAGKKLPKPYFCSRKCGQHYSGATYGHEVKHVAALLRKREASKYGKLQAWLTKYKVRHKFELPVGKYVFDLALKIDDRRILIEFDGAYHFDATIKQLDAKKERSAIRKGWEVHRVVQPKTNQIPTGYVRALVMGLK